MKIKFHYTYYILAISFVLCGRFSNLIVLTSIVIFHELGHFVVSLINHFEVDKIIIYSYGGITKLNIKINTKIIAELTVSLGGIFFQLVYYVFIYMLYKIGYVREYIYNMFVIYNKSILFFNLLPIIPLDGYKIMSLVLYYFLPYKVVNKIALLISFFLIFILSLINYNTGNYSFLLVLSVIMYYTFKYSKDMKYLFNQFLLERYLYKFDYKRVSCIRKIDYIYKERRHIIGEKGQFLTEKAFLNGKFKVNIKKMFD